MHLLLPDTPAHATIVALKYMYLAAMLQDEVSEAVPTMAAVLPTHGTDDLAQLLPPIASPSGNDLADLMKAVTPVETSVNSLAQRLNQVRRIQQVLHAVLLCCQSAL